MTPIAPDDCVSDRVVDDDEAKAAEKGAAEGDEVVSDTDVLEAETLTVTAKLKKRQALEDEIAAFLAKGGKITEVPAGGFASYMKSLGKLGGQNKIQRLANDRSVVDKLKLF